MSSFLESKVKENMERIFGTGESSREFREIAIMSAMGKVTDEMIENYHKQKQMEYELICRKMNEVNPSYAFEQEETRVLTAEEVEQLRMEGILSPGNVTNDVIPESESGASET
jgi:aspartokinase